MTIYIEDISDGQENIKISFVNEINSVHPPTDVTYESHCILNSDTLQEEFESVPIPCDCRVCSSDCACGSAYRNKKLCVDYTLSTSKPILECSTLCPCDDTCSNRLVQQGITFRLQVFCTPSKGFAVRTLEFVPKMSFVCEYAGEVLDNLEAEKRMERQSVDEPNYIYVLKESSSSGTSCTVIDPTNIGNVGRYLNHSCHPNLVPVPVRANSMIPKLCLFSKHDISPYEELTYDYSGKYFTPSVLSRLKTKLSTKVCHCQSDNCLGFLPYETDWLS